MKLVLTKGYKKKPKGLKHFFDKNGISIHGDMGVQSSSLSNGNQLFSLGNVVGFCDSGNNMRKVSGNDFTEVFQSGYSEDAVKKLEGRFIMMFCDQSTGSVHIFTDRYGQFDCYYFTDGNKTVFASDLSLLPESPSSGGYDQIGLTHTLTVYGSRPAKRQTIYKNVSRLGVGEMASITSEKTIFSNFEFKPIKIGSYGDNEHQLYADIFLDALKVRGSDKENLVYLSSGWDSTSILGGLVHIFGAEKVKGVIGRMRYSKRAGIINPFEIERAKKVADYYGVSLEVIEFDYSKKVPHLIFDDLKETMKNNFVFSPTIFNHGILADYVAKNFSNEVSVFTGEISDGAHNLGFSQFVTIFHPVQEFREYSDKMASYLYGPTFLDSFVNGKYKDDVIYNLLKSMAGDTLFEEQFKGNKKGKKEQLLASFFLRNQRLPLVSMKNNKLLTEHGRQQYSKEMGAIYLQDAADAITMETNYFWYLHLYSSFHWQSSTLATLPLTAQAYGFDIQYPFYDSRMQSFLAGMPENWGRGLEMKPTKYPLKWMLKNRIDYPTHLQVGPHSYLYDVDRSFNHSVELANHSAFTKLFRELLKRHHYRRIISPEIFNMGYIDFIVDRYVDGEEISGTELNTLFPLCYLSLIDWY